MRAVFRRIMLPSSPLYGRSSFSSLLAPLPSVPLLSQREAHIWYMVPDEVNDESLLKHYMELLPQSEKEKVLSMKGEKLQKDALLARALVRTTLSRYTNFTKHPRSLKFKKNRFGKPEVDWQFDGLSVEKPLQFNISHTSFLIACGVTLNTPIGIDVEEKTRKPSKSVLSLAKRYFSPEEIEYINSFNDLEDQRREFIKLWTLKEAYVKAIGRGFSGAPFKEFTIQYEGSKDRVARGPESLSPRIVVEAASTCAKQTKNFQFALLEVNSSHYLAVCKENDKNTTSMGDDKLKLKMWKTIPFLEDVCISESDVLLTINGLI